MSFEKESEVLDIDISELLRALWRRAWAIVLAALVFGAAAFGYTTHYITPQYQSSALLYVNSGTFSLDSKVFTISSGSVSNASNLVDIYIVIMKTRLTLNQVISSAKLPYTYEQLSKMVSASSVGDTGIFRVTVTSPDPTEAQLIANTIAEVLQIQIADVVDGSSVRVVDYAVVPNEKASPNISRYTMIGFMGGAALVAAIIILVQILDTTIHSEEDLLHDFDIPVLAEIPDLYTSKGHHYGEYSGKKGYGYGKKKKRTVEKKTEASDTAK